VRHCSRKVAPTRIDTEIDLGDRTALLTARINRRAKRLIVKVDPVAGRVLVTAPSKRALPEALRFARERIPWIRARMDEGLPAQPFQAGGVCPYRGIFHRVINEGAPRAPVRIVSGEPPQIVVGGESAHLNRRLCDWLKREAKRELCARSEEYSAILGKTPSRIQIRDTRSRWGSCTSDRVLSFSWRLVLAPPWILDYVAAHECAHLIHLDHSPEYWRVLARLGAPVEEARDWLERHGPALHAWGAERPPQRAAA
jgi:hypothetical protein